mgnify:CR=1
MVQFFQDSLVLLRLQRNVTQLACLLQKEAESKHTHRSGKQASIGETKLPHQEYIAIPSRAGMSRG